MKRIEISDEAYKNIIDFCGSTSCNWCPFGKTGYCCGTQCKIGEPEYWEVCEEEE